MSAHVMGRWISYLLLSAWMFGFGRVLLGALLLMFVVDLLLPRPRALYRAFRDAGRLRDEAKLNAANVTARRDLARIYLDVLRPGAALEVLEEGLARAPNDAELLHLSGVALVRMRRYEDALPRLVAAVESDPRVGFGQPFRVAGDALYALGRWDGALDAYERYLSTNGSDVAVHLQCARAHHRAGESDAVAKSLDEALATYRALPRRHPSRRVARYIEAQWARVLLLRDPKPVLYACLLLTPVVILVVSAYG